MLVPLIVVGAWVAYEDYWGGGLVWDEWPAEESFRFMWVFVLAFGLYCVRLGQIWQQTTDRIRARRQEAGA